MVKLPIYLDNNATTRVDPRVVEAMLPYFTDHYGNAASRHHRFGREAEHAVEEARAQVARLIGASPKEIIFTSGATESDNLAIKGVASMYRNKGNHLITVRTEHHAVLDCCRRLERQGFEVTYLAVDKFGRVTAEQVAEAINERTILVSVMAANNEIGTLQPIKQIGAVCKERGVFFHSDAVQAAGKLPLDVEDLGVDLVSLTAHKLYGPKGVGALYVRSRNPRVRPEPLLDGGGHERGLRSGTLPVPSVVGFGKACELCLQELVEEAPRLTRLRERLRQVIMERLDHVFLNGHPSERLPGNLNLSFAYVEGEALMMSMKNIAVSSGSACTSASLEPSYVLKALGVSDELAHSSIRFGLGRFSTEKEVDFAGQEVVTAVKHLRSLSPDYEMAQKGVFTA
ncbi:MAG TPA: IscS subfamily cysteine desulfurase [Gemmataceae bacterium]|jgi:cysteine desulfurase|nr:IscS subfamily cysteine desulfurase [Gemmataceae bacterium]